MVRARSAGVTGRSAGLSPRASLRADHLAALHAAAGQQHAEDPRPVVAAAGVFSFGVRPNSPMTITSVSPRAGRGRPGRRAAPDSARSSIGHLADRAADVALRAVAVDSSSCVSQPLSVTVTNGQPASTSRRASRQLWPTRCRP